MGPFAVILLYFAAATLICTIRSYLTMSDFKHYDTHECDHDKGKEVFRQYATWTPLFVVDCKACGDGPSYYLVKLSGLYGEFGFRIGGCSKELSYGEFYDGKDRYDLYYDLKDFIADDPELMAKAEKIRTMCEKAIKRKYNYK